MKTKTQKRHITALKILSAFLLPWLAGQLFGQTPRTARQQGNVVPDNQEVVMLEEFSVREVVDGSYDAVDTMLGSRVNTEVRNLPYNVNVVTSEFIRDFAAYDIDEELAYTSSFSMGQSNDTEYTLRGISISLQLRNGFRAEVLRGAVNTERVEVIKGPAAAIFGQTAPGGIVNTVTKRPKERFSGRTRFAFGSYEHTRAELELTGPLGSKDGGGIFKDTYYLITLGDYRRKFEQDFTFTDQAQGSITLTKRLGPNTMLTLDGEYIHVDSLRRDAVPYNQIQINGAWRFTDFAEDLLTFNTNSPDAFTERNQGVAYLTFEHRFNRVWSMKTAVNYAQARVIHFNYVGINSARGVPGDPVDRRRVGDGAREPEHATQGRYLYGFQNDLLARFNTGSVEHQMLLTVDFTSIRNTRSNYRLASGNRTNPEYNVRPIYVDASDYFLRPFTPADYPRANTASDNLTEIYGTFLRYQIAAFSGRLIAMAGVRYDYTAVNIEQKTKVPSVFDIYNKDAFTPQIGMNFKITENFTLYANRSTSFIAPTAGGAYVRVDQKIRLDNEEGLGYEFGIKGELFDRQLHFTLAGFYIDRDHVRSTEVEWLPVDENGDGVPDVDPEGNPIYDFDTITRTDGLERSKGVEFDFNWKFGRSLQLFGGYCFVDSYIVRAGRDLDAVGRRPRSSPEHRFSAGLRYAFPRQFLDGLVVTLGAVYMGESPAYNPVSGGVAGDDNYVRSHNGARDIMIPSYITWNAGIGYRFRLGRFIGKNLTHGIQVNFKNIFDNTYIASNSRTADRFTVMGTYSVSF